MFVCVQPAEELQLVWCKLLTEALSALWTSSVTSDPDRWLKWDPLTPECHLAPKLPHERNTMVPAFFIFTVGLGNFMKSKYCYVTIDCFRGQHY